MKMGTNMQTRKKMKMKMGKNKNKNKNKIKNVKDDKSEEIRKKK